MIDRYYGKLLRGQSRDMYRKLYRKFMDEDYSKEIVVDLTDMDKASNDFNSAFKAVRDDFPEFFFMGNPLEMIRTGTKAKFTFQVLYSEADIRRARKQLKERIGETVEGTENLSRLEAEKIIYERIAGSLSYVNINDHSDHNIIGPVFKNTGVCEGVNALLMLCLRRAGIPCIKIYGSSQRGGPHCWTIAWINGTPVHIDVTWDLGKPSGFQYFNLSDRQIEKDHYDFKGKDIPVCLDESYNYRKHFGLVAHIGRGLKKIAESDER